MHLSLRISSTGRTRQSGVGGGAALCITEGTESQKLENVRGMASPTEVVGVEIVGPEGYLKVKKGKKS